MTPSHALSASFVGQPLAQWATTQATAPALLCDQHTTSWQALYDQVQALALRIYQRSGRGQAVALDLPNPQHLILAFLAVVRSGNRAQVFDPGWTQAQRQAIIESASPTWLLDTPTFTKLLADSANSPPHDATVPEPTPEQAFYVGFTSGSTGLPKGYRRRHQSWLASFALSEQLFDWQPGDVVMAPGSLATSLHLYGVIHALHAGRPVVLVPRFQPRSILQALHNHAVTTVYGTPTQVHLLLQAARRYGYSPFTGLRHLIISGAKWPEATREQLRAQFPQADLTEFYGTSEMSFIALHNDHHRAPPGSVGQPVPGVSVRIGADIDHPVPAGERGRIWVKSPLLFDDYECGGGDEIRRDRGWLSVGDHGYVDADGHLYLVGREKRMLVSSGQNLYPEEVEAWLCKHPGVQQAALFGLPDPLRGQKIVAAIQPEYPDLQPEPIRHHCAERFPLAQVPKAWVMIDDWPLTPSGKTDLVALQRLVQIHCEGCTEDSSERSHE